MITYTFNNISCDWFNYFSLFICLLHSLLHQVPWKNVLNLSRMEEKMKNM